MIKSFTGREFAKALAEGTLKEPIVKIGMVKKDEADSSDFLFAEGFACANWIKIPVDLIEEVKYLTTIQCRDHQHPLVQMTFKEPANTEAQVFAELARSSRRPSRTRTPNASAARFGAVARNKGFRWPWDWVDDLPSETCVHACGRSRMLCELFFDDCSEYMDACVELWC